MTAQQEFWNRGTGEIMSVRDAGAVGDGVADDTTAVQNAYDALAAAGGGTLFFPRGTYRIALRMTSRNVHIHGAGRGSTILKPSTTTGIALNALYRTGSVDIVQVSDIEFAGPGSPGTFQGTLFQAGANTYATNDEYSGGTRFTDCTFHSANKLISRKHGQIWLSIENCILYYANYCIFSEGNIAGGSGGDPMHAGCLYVTKSRISQFAKAMCYLTSPVVGSGQIVFDSCIVEIGVGFVFYINSFGSAEGLPGIAVNSCWNEVTATGTGIVIEGAAAANARYLYANACSCPIVFRDTPIGSLTLIDSKVETIGCDLSLLDSVSVDSNSRLVHRDARSYDGTTFGPCESISGPTVPSGLQTPWFRMPLPRWMSKAVSGNVVQKNDASATIAFVGTVSRNTVAATGDAALPGQANSQDLTINSGETLYPTSDFTVAANKWVVVIYVYKKISGPGVTLQIDGGTGISGPGAANSTGWEALVGVLRNGGSAATGDYVSHTASATTVIRIGGYAVVAFDTRQQAVDFANSMMFPG